MKTIFTVIALCFALNGFAAIEPVNRSTNVKYDGSIDSATLEKEFINVINREGSTIDIGKVVVLDPDNDDGASVIIDTTAGAVPICVMAVSCADDALCKCQVYGLFDEADFDSTAGAAVAGKPFFLSTSNAGYIAAITEPSGSDVKGGVFYDAAAASASVQVFLKLK